MEGLDAGRIAEIVRNENPLIAGITVLTHALPNVHACIEKIKELSDCEIVAGGPHITADPEMISHLRLRYGLRGECEYTFLKLVEHLIEKTYSLHEIEGLIINENNSVRAGKPSFVEDIDSLPEPARHLVPTAGYKYNVFFSSRGCPYNCIYCAEQCRKVRYRSPEKVVDEVERIVNNFGVRDIDFADSVFTINRDHVIGLCSKLVERRLKIRWSCITRADLIDRELLKVMKESGCDFISFGVESGVERIRFLGGKQITDSQIRQAFADCRSIGLRTRASVIFGNPGETLDDMRCSIEFTRQLKPDYALFNIAQLFPGTPLFSRLLKEGRVDGDIWKNFMAGSISSLDCIPEGVSQADIHNISREAFNRFYLDWGYIGGKATRLHDFSDFKELVFILLSKAGFAPIEESTDNDMQKCID